MAVIQVYVDGSYNPRTSIFGSGAIIVRDNNILHEFSAAGPEASPLARYRNVAGEIYAAITALDLVKGYFYKPGDEVQLYYDYEGLGKWPTGQWSTNNTLSQTYAQVVKEMPFELKYFKVKAHANNVYNERADKLARKAVGLS